MASIVSRTFKSGNSEAVRLPKGLGFGVGVAVRIERDGDRVVLRAAHAQPDTGGRLCAMIEDMNRIGAPDGARQERDAPLLPDRERL
jgi:antitoxin VapB